MTALRAPARCLLLPVILSGTFVQLVSVTVMQVGVPDVQRDLGAGPGESQLVLAGYTLTYACFLIVSARLGDRYGYRRMFVIGMALFTVAAAGSAAAPDALLLITGRLVQGVGSGIMAPQILSFISTALPENRRPAALSAYGATMAGASLAGPLLGGLLIEADPLGLGWRAAMLLTVPVGIVALLLSPWLPAAPAEREAGERIDAVGASLSLVGLALLVFPLTVGRDAGWPLWTLVSLGSALVLLTGFAVSQRKVANPLVHPSTLTDPSTRWGLAIVLVFNAGVPSFTLLLSMHLQGALGASPIQAALTVTPYAVGAIAGSGIANALGRRFGAWTLAVASALLGLVSLVVAVTMGDPGARWELWAALCVGGIAFGLFTASAFTQVLSRVGAEAATSVSGLLPTAQQLGGTLGVTLAGMAYSAPAASADGAWWHAMTYEAVVFALAAVFAGGLVGRRREAGQPAAETA